MSDDDRILGLTMASMTGTASGLKVWDTPVLEVLPIADHTENGAFNCKPVEQPALYKAS